jgi:hypothetical protein
LARSGTIFLALKEADSSWCRANALAVGI